MFQFKPNPIRQEEENKPEEKKKVTTWQDVSATMKPSKKKSNRIPFEVDPTAHMIQASGIELLQKDVFDLLGESDGYFSSYKAGSSNAGLLSRITSMRGAIAEEKKYFERNARFFSAEQLADYNAAMSAWDASLQSYESAMKTGGAAYEWLNQDNMVFNQAFTPQGTSFRASSREAAEYGMGLSSLEQQVQTLAQQAEEWTKVGYRPTAEQAAQMRQNINQAIAGVKYARYYAGQNSIHFTQKEMDAMEAHFNSLESFLQSVQEYTADADMTNPLTGKKIPSLPKTATDVNADGTADIMYPGGELGVMQNMRSAQRTAAQIQQYITRKDFVSQDQGQFLNLFEKNVSIAAGKETTVIDYAEQDGNKTTYHFKNVPENEDAFWLADVFGADDESNKVVRQNAAEEAAQRIWYAIYTHNVDEETFGKMLDAISDSGLLSRMLPSEKELQYEYRYNAGLTRENIPYKSTEKLFEEINYLAVGSTYTGEYSLDPQRGMVLESALAYLANESMTKEEYDRFMQFVTLAQNKQAQENPAYTIDYEKYRQQRQANGLNENLQGKESAIIYPDVEATSYAEAMGSGMFDVAGNNILSKYPAYIDEAMHTAAGGVTSFLGALVNGGGLWNNSVGDWLLDEGERMMNYDNPGNEEAAYQAWVQAKEMGVLFHKGNKLEKWIGNMLQSTGTALGEMLVAGGVGYMAGAGVPVGMLSKAASAGSLPMYMTRNASNFTMSSFAAINTFDESKGKDELVTTILKTIGAGALEYFTNGLFDGNKLIDAGDSGKVAQWVTDMTTNETVRKLVKSRAADVMGEGLEEVASAVGNAAIDYVLTGSSDLTLGQAVEEFAVGMFVSLLIEGGSASAEALGRGVEYVKVATFSEFNNADRKNVEALNTKMCQYAVQYFAGDAELMRANGWSDAQIEKAQKQWQSVLNEYNTAYDQMLQSGKIKKEDTVRPSAQGLIENAEGTFGEVSAQHFTSATVQEDLDDVIAVYDKMENSATELDSAIAINANIAKMAQTVMKNAEAALDEGYIGQLQYDNYRSVLIDIYEDSSGNLDAYLDEVYGARTDAAVVETEAETPAAESMQPETAVQTEITLKNMTAEPSENLGGTENAEVFDDGSQRDESLGTGRQAGAMAEGTGGSIAGSQTRTQAAIISNVKKNGTVRSARSIGVENGSEDATLYVLSDEDIAKSEQWQKIKTDAEADGASVVLFAGDLKVYNPTTKKYARVEGIHQVDQYGNTTYYVKADKLSRSAQQIYMHEKFHDIVNENPQILGNLVKALKAQYNEQEIAALLSSYIEAYGGIYGRFSDSMTEKEQDDLAMKYWGEVFADVYAGIRRGRVSTAKAKQIMDSQTTEIQRAAQNRKAMQNKNAPPTQQFSRLTEEDLESYLNAGNRTNNWRAEALQNGEKVILTSDNEVTDYIEAAIKGDRQTTVAYGRVSDRLAEDVLIASDGKIDISNSFMELVSDDLFHAYSGHLKAKQHGDINLSKEQFLELPIMLDSYDEIVYARKFSSGATRIVVSKVVPDGRIVIIEVVSKSHGAIQFKNMYGLTEEKYQREFGEDIERQEKRRSKTNSGGVENQPNISPHDVASSDDSLSQDNLTVKQEFSFDEDAGQLDQEYLSAVESGDMETAQRMVDAAAKKAGYTIRAYHGTTNREEKRVWNANTRSWDTEYSVFTVFKRQYPEQAGHFFNSDIDNAGGYGSTVYSVYLMMKKPLIIDCKGQNYASITHDDKEMDTYEWAEYAKKHRYDGVIFENISDGVEYDDLSKLTTNYVIFDSNRIKSADPVTYDNNGNVIPLSKRFNVLLWDIRYSFDDDVAELDAGYARHMAEDDTPEGLALDDDQIADYHALAKEQKERRAKNATANSLKNRIKSSEQAVAAHREARNALKNIGGLTKEAAEQLDKKIELIRETMQIDRAALKEKQSAEEKEKKEERKKKQKEEIQGQKAKIAQKELRQDLLNLFSVKSGVRIELAQTIDAFSDELIRSGKLTNEQRKLLFDTLYEYGEEFIEADAYYGDIRKELHEGRIYVSDSVRAEFGDDWESFRKRAWGNRIYLTNNQRDMGIDSWTQSLQEEYGGSFDGNNDLKTQLEIIIELAEEGKGENVTIAEMMRRNQDDYGWSVEEQMDELEQKVDRMLETFAQKADLEIRLRQESVRKIMNERASYIKRMEDHRAARMENTARNQVMRGIEKLSKMRRKASPEYRKQIDEVLKDIDTVARSISARGLEDLQELSRLYLEQKETQGENFLSSPYVEARLGRLQKTQLDDMSIDDVRELGRTVSSIANAIQNSNKLLADQKKQLVETVAENVHQEVQKAKGSKGGALRNYLLNHMDAKRVFGQLSGWSGGAFEALGENLSKGQERMMHYQLNAMRIFDDFLAKKENQKWVKKAAGKDAEWIKIEVPYRVEVSEGVFEMKTKQIQITPMMRISLLLHSKNEDNLRHIKGGGIRVPNKELYKKGKMKEALVRGEIVKMDPATVRAIVKECTEEEKNFAKLLEQYFNGLSKDAINEVSMLLDGFERAGGEHYYHIKTDPAFLKKQNAEIKRDLSVQALGSVVNERLHASNPIVLEDATAALMEHIENISKYYGFAVPLRDLNAVLSHTFHQKDNAFSDSVMNTIQQKWGSGAEEYIDKLMADLQMPERSSDLISSFAAKLRGNYAQAVIAANLSSLLKQMASYPAALPYLKASGLVHGLKKLGKNDLKTLEKYSAVYWYRNQGNATMELSDALKRKDFGDSLPWLFNATQKMDSFTTRRLLAACEYRVQHDMNLRPGTQEEIDSGVDRYWTEVAKLFNDVVLKTQSNSTTMEKPQITRANASNLSRFFTMFRSDAFQQYNMMVEAFGRLNAARRTYKADDSAQNKKALKEARKFTARTMISILTSQMCSALVPMLLKVLRADDDEFRDEDGNFDWGKIVGYFVVSIAEGYSGFLVGAEILYSAAEVAINKFVDGDARWWDIEPTGLSTINDGISALLDLIGAVEEGKLTDGKKAFRAAAIALSKGIGFPAENLEKYLLMTTRWFAPEWAEQYQNFWEEIDKNNLSKESMRTIGDAIGVLMDNRTDGLSDEHKDEIARLYVAGGVGAVPTAIPSSVSYTKADGEEVKVELNGKQQEKYREVWRTTISNSIAELISSDAYEQADDEGKAKLLDKLYKYANQIAQNAVVPEKEIAKWVQQGQNAVDDGIPLAEYICFRVALSEIDGKDDDGETVDGLNAQRCMEYLETMGWSDEQEKNIYLDVIASESKSADTNALMDAGMTWEQTNEIVSILGDRAWEHMNAIIESNASEKVKAKALEVYASDEEKKLIRTGYKFGVLLKWYAEVRNNADSDGSGTVSQEEAAAYIYGMGLTISDAAYLWQMVTDGKKGKKNPFSTTWGSEFWYAAHENDPPEEDEKTDSGKSNGGLFEIDAGGIFG